MTSLYAQKNLIIGLLSCIYDNMRYLINLN
jgi:hypothetical protein